MTYIYAIKDNVLAIRATTKPVKWERSTFIDEISIHLRKYMNRSATFSDYIAPDEGYYIMGTTSLNSFQDDNNKTKIVNTYDMVVITIYKPEKVAENNSILTMDILEKLAQEFALKHGKSLTLASSAEFNSYVFNDLRFVEVYPNLGIFGRPRPSKTQAAPFLAVINPVTNETIPSPDSVNPLPSEKQTIFPGFGPSMR